MLLFALYLWHFLFNNFLVFCIWVRIVFVITAATLFKVIVAGSSLFKLIRVYNLHKAFLNNCIVKIGLDSIRLVQILLLLLLILRWLYVLWLLLLLIVLDLLLKLLKIILLEVICRSIGYLTEEVIVWGGEVWVKIIILKLIWVVKNLNLINQVIANWLLIIIEVLILLLLFILIVNKTVTVYVLLLLILACIWRSIVPISYYITVGIIETLWVFRRNFLITRVIVIYYVLYHIHSSKILKWILIVGLNQFLLLLVIRTFRFLKVHALVPAILKGWIVS